MQSPNQRINVYLNDGGLGDRVATMPAILYCLRTYPHVSMDIWAPAYFIDLARHLLRGYEERAAVMDMARMPQLLDQTLPSVVFHNSYHTTLRTHLVDRAFRILNDSDDVAIMDKCYPRLRLDEIDTIHLAVPAPYKYVCLTPGYTAAVRKLPSNVWNEIAKYLISKHYVPVWIGARADTIAGGLTPESEFTEDVDYSVGYDYRDKTTLLGAAKLMALSSAVVGLDNGLLHLAGCTDVPIVAGYTSVDPLTRMPFRRGMLGCNVYEVVPPDTVACKFRQTRTHFDYQTDFRTCPCEGRDCVASLTADMFIEQLEKIL